MTTAPVSEKDLAFYGGAVTRQGAKIFTYSEHFIEKESAEHNRSVAGQAQFLYTFAVCFAPLQNVKLWK